MVSDKKHRKKMQKINEKRIGFQYKITAIIFIFIFLMIIITRSDKIYGKPISDPEVLRFYPQKTRLLFQRNIRPHEFDEGNKNKNKNKSYDLKRKDGRASEQQCCAVNRGLRQANQERSLS